MDINTMLDYDRIVAMVEREIVLDEINMDLESIRNPVLQSKYLKIFTDCSFATVFSMQCIM